MGIKRYEVSEAQQLDFPCARPSRHRPKRGGCNQALGRSPGGLTSKWYIAVDSFGRPVRFILTGGNASDASFAIPLVIGLQARHVIADKAYDGHAILKTAAPARSFPNAPVCPDSAPSTPPSTNCEIASNEPSASLSSSGASQPDTTASPKTTSQAYTSPPSASGSECRFNLTLLWQKRIFRIPKSRFR